MRRLHTIPVLGLTALTLMACADQTTAPEAELGADAAALAKGGNGKGNGGGGGNPDAAGLGGMLFADEALSLNGDMACQTCHEPSMGFAAPGPGITTQGSVVEGSNGGFGNRKPPSAAYATLSPIYDPSGGGATGGNFWDGRATGELLGNPAADQALGPFLNPVEQALPEAGCVVYRVATGAYVSEFTTVWGEAMLDIQWPSDADNICRDPDGSLGLTGADADAVATAYDQIALSIAAFEGSASVNRFSSRFDTNELTAFEAEGAKLFGSKAKCQQCHDDKGSQPLFTDFKYHNLGVPPNPYNPDRMADPSFVDTGLGSWTEDRRDDGRFKTPTVRNAGMGVNTADPTDDTRTYMHNGVLTSLKQVVDFYNTRDVLPECGPEVEPDEYGSFGAGCWPAPEIAANVDSKNMGNLGLTEREVDAIVAFMMALSDR